MELIIILAAIGFCLSLYALYLDRKVQEDPNYHPVCNISDRISCTKPITSGYGKLFGFSNSILGIIFYPILGLLAFLNQPTVLLLAASGLLLFTIFLAYVLFAKVKAICPVCIAIYLVNISIFIVSLAAFL